MPMKFGNQRKPLTRHQRQFRRIMLVLAIVAILSLIIGMLIGMMIGASGAEPTTNERTYINEPMKSTVYAHGEEYETIPLIAQSSQWIDLGTFTCYAYDACYKCCGKTDKITKSGTVATAGRTIAVDPTVIPLGSIVDIDGVQYTAEDVGGKIKGKVIDIYFDTHAEALEYGKQTHSVKILK